MRKGFIFFMGVILLLSTTGCSANNEKENTEKVSNTSNIGYAEKIFDNSYVHTIDVQISEEDWADLCANPLEKTKYEVDVIIDGEKIENVSFATKGNTSLSSVALDENSDRYSFKINFGKFVEGQTYYGLDKLNLNNLYADATYMKDYLSYEIFREAGVDASLTSYVQISINGEAFGLYIAVEEVGDSYLARNESDGELYKPETERLANIGEVGGIQQMPGGMEKGEMPQMPDGMGNGEMPDGMEGEGRPQMPDDMEKGEMPQMPGGITGDNGASLQYTDDKIESYSDIFDNAETDVDEEDKNRLIASLKGLSEGEDLENYIDVDEVIRYFVAHNFVINYDSYTGNMLHNYYLLEEDGVLSMLPWDYNLAFGAFANRGHATTDATSIINYGIDSPLSGTTEEERPMWSWIVSNEEYLDKYHQVYDELLEDYFESGEFSKEIERVYEMIKPYIEKDASAFYSIDECETAYETLKEFCLLRSESIRLQLDGKLATVTEEQKTEDMVSASEINIQDMGSQGKESQHMRNPNVEGLDKFQP